MPSRRLLPILCVAVAGVLAACGSHPAPETNRASGTGKHAEPRHGGPTGGVSHGGRGLTGGSSGGGSCAFSAEFDGRTYGSVGVEVSPLEGRSLGTATSPDCADTGGTPGPDEHFDVAEFPGLSPDQAIVIVGRDDMVLVPNDADGLPPEVQRLVHAPGCDANDEPIDLAGPWLGILGADGRTEVDLEPPYVVTLHVDETSSDRYDRAFLDVLVPRSLGHPISHDDSKRYLQHPGRIVVTAHCDGPKYVADAVRATN